MWVCSVDDLAGGGCLYCYYDLYFMLVLQVVVFGSLMVCLGWVDLLVLVSCLVGFSKLVVLVVCGVGCLLF